MKKLCIVLAGVFFLMLFIGAALALLSKVPLGEKIALIRLEGPIVDSTDTVQSITEYAKDSSIKAIVFRVNSPGGGVAASQEIYEELKKAASKKPVVVSMGSLAASGGYYVSVPATRIIANPGTITGSIGVIMEIPNLKGLMDKIGVKSEVVKSGRYKDMASVFREMGKEERGILQGVLDDVHGQFIKAVAENRKIPIEKAQEFADGRIFTGRQALELGLVDELGTIEDAINAAKTLAGIKGEPSIVKKKKKSAILELLSQKVSSLPDMSPAMQIKYIFSP